MLNYAALPVQALQTGRVSPTEALSPRRRYRMNPDIIAVTKAAPGVALYIHYQSSVEWLVNDAGKLYTVHAFNEEYTCTCGKQNGRYSTSASPADCAHLKVIRTMQLSHMIAKD